MFAFNPFGGGSSFGAGGYTGGQQSGNNPYRQPKSTPFSLGVAQDNFTVGGAGRQGFSTFQPASVPKAHFASAAMVQPAQQSTQGDQLTAFRSQLQSGEVVFRRGKNWDSTKDFGYA